MRHATEAHLRRIGDEPLAVPDRVLEHIAHCQRCKGRLAAIEKASERSLQLLGGPQPVPDVDSAWSRFEAAARRGEAELGAAELTGGSNVRQAMAAPLGGSRRLGRDWRPGRLSLRSGLAVGAATVVLTGTAAAATITTIFAPTHVAPLQLSKSDISALTDFMGLGQLTAHGSRRFAPNGTAGTSGPSGVQPPYLLGGFPSPSGSLSTSFGTISWTSSGPAQQVATVAEAATLAGFPVTLPSDLPSGVSSPTTIVVQPRVKVTLTFKQSVPDVGGSSVVLDTGPAVVVTYGSSGGPVSTTMGILTMPRPVATSSGASLGQIESFLLDQPGVPPDLAEELRLLGGLGTTLPVPVPPGATERSVEINGSPGVLVSDTSNVVSGVVWEDSTGMLRAVAGLVDQQDALNVAGQIG